MRVSVYLRTQNHVTEPAKHQCSRVLARLITFAALAVPVGHSGLQLATDEDWKSIKDRFRAIPLESKYGTPEPRSGPKRTFWNEPLLLTYPLPDQRTGYVMSFSPSNL